MLLRVLDSDPRGQPGGADPPGPSLRGRPEADARSKTCPPTKWVRILPAGVRRRRIGLLVDATSGLLAVGGRSVGHRRVGRRVVVGSDTSAARRAISVVIPQIRPGANPQPGIRVDPGNCRLRGMPTFEDWIRVTTVPGPAWIWPRLDEPDHLETALRLRRSDPAIEKSLERGRGRRGQVVRGWLSPRWQQPLGSRANGCSTGSFGKRGSPDGSRTRRWSFAAGSGIPTSRSRTSSSRSRSTVASTTAGRSPSRTTVSATTTSSRRAGRCCTSPGRQITQDPEAVISEHSSHHRPARPP